MKLQVGTSFILEDEPCLKLWEEDVQTSDYSGFRRYRVFRVLRPNGVVEFREDLGKASNFKGIEPVILWTGIVDSGVFWGHRVGEAREMLDQYRNHIHFDRKELAQVDNIRL